METYERQKLNPNAEDAHSDIYENHQLGRVRTLAKKEGPSFYMISHAFILIFFLVNVHVHVHIHMYLRTVRIILVDEPQFVSPNRESLGRTL